MKLEDLLLLAFGTSPITFSKLNQIYVTIVEEGIIILKEKYKDVLQVMQQFSSCTFLIDVYQNAPLTES